MFDYSTSSREGRVSMVNQYNILRVMNNNVILVNNVEKRNEVVLIGKGLGFGRKRGEIVKIDDNEIEKAFVTGSKNLKESYLQMLKEVNSEIVEICVEVIMKAEKILGTLSERSLIVIIDHVSFAIEKLKKNIQIENPFVYEIKSLYPEEYSIGEYARKRIIEVIGVDISEDEIGFIALHLNAAKQHKGVSETFKTTRLIRTMIDLIENELDFSLTEYSRLYNLLLAHIRRFIQRMEDDEHSKKHPLYYEATRNCPQASRLALKVGRYLSKEKGYELEETETFYLLLHIDRLIRKSQSI